MDLGLFKIGGYLDLGLFKIGGYLDLGLFKIKGAICDFATRYRYILCQGRVKLCFCFKEECHQSLIEFHVALSALLKNGG